MKNKIVYVYEDLDHCDIEVFSTLKKAKAYAEEQWPMPEDLNLEVSRWEENGNDLHDLVSDYVIIHVKEIR